MMRFDLAVELHSWKDIQYVNLEKRCKTTKMIVRYISNPAEYGIIKL